MKLNTRRVPGALAVLLGALVLASTGFIYHEVASAPDSPIVATAAPLSEATIAPLTALDRATEAVTARVVPSVVKIEVIGQSQAPQRAMQGPDPNDIPAPFRQFFFPQGPYQRPQPQVFQAIGTGIIISPDGYIVTNNHVVNGAKTVKITLHDQKSYTAKVVGTDKATDLAVVKIDAGGLTSAAFGDSSQVRPGQQVLAIGDPLGMDFTVTRGIVSAVNRSRTASDGSDSRGTFIQTDAPINHGNSGGPLVDARGEVIGVNTEMLSESNGSIGIGFAIPSNLVKSTAAELIKNGKVLRGYLGINVTDVNPELAASLDAAGAKGALVNSVNGDSPASKAGIKPYDIITGIDGQAVATGSDLQTITGGTAPGTTVHLDVLRNGKRLEVPVTLGNYDEATSGTGTAEDSGSDTNDGTPKLGITVSPLTPDTRNQYRIPDNVNGVLVDSVDPGGPAMLANVAPGDVIEQVNRHAVSSPDELKQQLKASPAGKSILLMVHKQNGDFILPVTPQ